MVDKHNWLVWVIVGAILLLLAFFAVRLIVDTYEKPTEATSDVYGHIMEYAMKESELHPN